MRFKLLVGALLSGEQVLEILGGPDLEGLTSRDWSAGELAAKLLAIADLPAQSQLRRVTLRAHARILMDLTEPSDQVNLRFVSAVDRAMPSRVR